MENTTNDIAEAWDLQISHEAKYVLRDDGSGVCGEMDHDEGHVSITLEPVSFLQSSMLLHIFSLVNTAKNSRRRCFQ